MCLCLLPVTAHISYLINDSLKNLFFDLLNLHCWVSQGLFLPTHPAKAPADMAFVAFCILITANLRHILLFTVMKTPLLEFILWTGALHIFHSFAPSLAVSPLTVMFADLLGSRSAGAGGFLFFLHINGACRQISFINWPWKIVRPGSVLPCFFSLLKIASQIHFLCFLILKKL